MANFACANVRADPFVEFGRPISLADRAVGLFSTEMTTKNSIMRLIENAILQILVMRNNDARSIRSIRAIKQ